MATPGNPRAEARRRAGRIRDQAGVELTAEEIPDSPHVFIGSTKDLALAPVVEELAGQ